MTSAEGRTRAEHLLRMVHTIASREFVSTWTTNSNPFLPRPPRVTSAAGAIYSMASRGQSQTFIDNVLLRIGKYLLAVRITNRVHSLRSQRASSKQRVPIAGSTGEGNAVTRALREFLDESIKETRLDAKERELELQRCQTMVVRR